MQLLLLVQEPGTRLTGKPKESLKLQPELKVPPVVETSPTVIATTSLPWAVNVYSSISPNAEIDRASVWPQTIGSEAPAWLGRKPGAMNIKVMTAPRTHLAARLAGTSHL